MKGQNSIEKKKKKNTNTHTYDRTSQFCECAIWKHATLIHMGFRLIIYYVSVNAFELMLRNFGSLPIGIYIYSATTLIQKNL